MTIGIRLADEFQYRYNATFGMDQCLLQRTLRLRTIRNSAYLKDTF